MVKSISILRNVRNFSRYQATKARLRADPPLRDEQEAAYLRPFAERTPLAWGDTILFHGTSDKGVTSINEIGFSKHYSHTGLLGKGLYFSPYIQKCDVYASKLLPPSVVAPSGEIKVIIVCAVVLGRIYDNKVGLPRLASYDSYSLQSIEHSKAGLTEEDLRVLILTKHLPDSIP